MELKEEFRERRSFTEDFKRKVIKEIITGKHSKKESMVLYDLPFMTIKRWLNKLGQSVILEEGIEMITLKKSNMSRPKKITESEKVRELQAQIKQLEMELKDAKLKAKLYDKMIDIAEEQFKIPIRKKYVTRQSPKPKKKK